MPLFEAARHEPLRALAWDERAARAWVEDVVADAHERYHPGRLWPPHPLDLEGRPAAAPFTGLYHGAAGVVWALESLARKALAARGPDYASAMDELVVRNARDMAQERWGTESYLIGRSGVLLLAYRLTRSPALADAIEASVRRNASHPADELMWGVPGTLHVALAMHEWTGEPRWAAAYREGAEHLAHAFAFDDGARCRLFTQDLYGERIRYLGAAHGFAGAAEAVLRGAQLLDDEARAWWRGEIVATALGTAVHADGRVNWPLWWPPGTRKLPLLQWCHGAPGVVTSLASLDDARLDAALEDAGELVWHAGPLGKGGGLCHGTAGNGWTFLALHARTGEDRWLHRAQSFAMHAMAQCDAHAARYGQRRYSLWTGDPGTALFVAGCVDRDARLPHVQAD